MLAGIAVAASSLGVLPAQEPVLAASPSEAAWPAGYVFLGNKYYLDVLYENVVVGTASRSRSPAAYWFNQNVIDGVVNGVGTGAVGGADATYKNVDQTRRRRRRQRRRLRRRGVAEQALRTVQTGKVQQYGALLFAAAGIAALILVIVV